jgi:cysteine desulfurase
MAYFDWNATTPLHPAAVDILREGFSEDWANPSSLYRLGTVARNKLEDAREQISRVLGCLPESVVFTSGATEANNAVIREIACTTERGELWVSAVEHAAVAAPANRWWRGRLRPIPVDNSGKVLLSWVAENLAVQRPAMVAVMAANNETGVIQPWREIARMCAEEGIPFHCDAAQWVGKTQNAEFSHCTSVALSGHKFGAPKGLGILVLQDLSAAIRIQEGGKQENEHRAGTENLCGIRAMAAALESVSTSPDTQSAARDAFEARLRTAIPGTTVNGRAVSRLWNTSSVTLPEFRATRWITRLDRIGFEVSGGSACSSGATGPSAVLTAMGHTPNEAERTIRISSGWDTELADWNKLSDAMIRVWNELKSEGAKSSTIIEIP